MQGPPATTRLGVRVVSPKTPRDGRLEIGDRAAATLEAAGTFLVDVGAQAAPGLVARFDCDCRDDTPHAYVESTVLTTLRPGAEVDLTFDPVAARVIVRSTGRRHEL